ncbi:serine hydrolase domain-containing protein [Robertkochia aurantiaca]|uniref:serine hydrolase domain-containing protein n=1 Tax=Robertkochia aurantiaca TaxID=2873700 RepID=UPI001CCC71D0|nr:serine hydrolase [Robertkochia sp. 3YJGBD-33]
MKLDKKYYFTEASLFVRTPHFPFTFYIISILFFSLSSCSTESVDEAFISPEVPVDEETPETPETPPDQDNDDSPDTATLYFPPLGSEAWETLSPESLGWDLNARDELLDFMEQEQSSAFLLIKDGRIVIEEYWGQNFGGNDTFDSQTVWYWASAGKGITSFLTGLAQEQGYLSIQDPTSDYLGEGWTSMEPDKESLITVENQLTMTTGLDYRVQDPFCTDPECLEYRTDAGSQWYYHNAPYTLLDAVISAATGTEFETWSETQLESRIGMEGYWEPFGYNNVYWSTARDAARFGLLILNEGNWEEQVIMSDSQYFQQMISTSQELNPSYGYLWWLNGKEEIKLPGSNNVFQSSLSPSGPADMIVAAGLNGQYIDVVPSQNLVVIRLGDSPDGSEVPLELHDRMWQYISRMTGE